MSIHVQQQFLIPMLRAFTEPPGADAAGFFADLTEELARFSPEVLAAAAASLKKTRKYRTFPTTAECIGACDEVKHAASRAGERPYVSGRTWVKLGTPEWREWDEHWRRERGVKAPIMRSVTGEDGWYFTSILPLGKMRDGVPI